MKCPRCQQDAPSDADFCPECGAKLAAVCGSCGTANAPAPKFCKKCGQQLGSESRASHGVHHQFEHGVEDLPRLLGVAIKAGGDTEAEFALAVLQNYRGETSAHVVLKELVSRFPNDPRKMVRALHESSQRWKRLESGRHPTAGRRG
jgi:Double zinc ribbon